MGGEFSFRGPVLVKTSQAASSELSHLMAICLTPESLRRAVFDKQYEGAELIVQEFVPHGGVIHKIYVIGDSFAQQARVSIPDLDADSLSAELRDAPWFFDSQKPFKTQLPVKVDDQVRSDEDLNPQKVAAISELLQKQLGLSLFGFDLIQRSDTPDHLEWHLIDVNFFPGFKNLPDLRQKVESLFAREITRLRAAQ